MNCKNFLYSFRTQANSLTRSDVFSGILILSVTSYLIFKGAITSFTYDESTSYLYGARGSYYDIIRFTYASSNNHILNTLFMKVSSGIFGHNELWLRLHSILSFLIYGIFSYLILKKLDFFGAVFLLPLLIFNPFLIDFFALARGYALGLAFGITTLFYNIKYFENYNRIYLNISLGTAFLMVISVFSFLYLYVAIFLSLIFITFMINRPLIKDFNKFWKPLLIGGFVLFFIIIQPITTLRSKDQLYFGGTTNFWQDTVLSLINASSYNADYGIESPIKYFVIIILIIATAISIYLILKKRVIYSDKLLLVHCTIILLIIYGLCELNFQILGIKFLYERTGIFLIPLFSLLLCGILHLTLKKYKIPYTIIIVILGSVILVKASSHQYKYYDSYLYWRYDSKIKEVFGLAISQQNKDSVEFSVEWVFSPTFLFYKESRGLDKINISSDQENPSFLKSDYVYITNRHVLKDTLESISHFEKKKVYKYPDNIYGIRETIFFVKND